MSEPSSNGTLTPSGTESRYSTAVLDLTGTPRHGEVWTVDLTNTNGTHPTAVTVNDADNDGVSIDELGTLLAATINTNAGSSEYSASYAGGQLTLTHAAGLATDALSVAAAPQYGTVALDSANSTRALSALQIDLSSLSVNSLAETWTLRIDGTDYTVEPRRDTGDIAASIAATGVSGFGVSANGSELTATNSAPFTTDLTAPAGSGTPTLTLEAEVTLSGSVSGDTDTWTLTVDGNDYSITPDEDDDLDDVGGDLANHSDLATDGYTASYNASNNRLTITIAGSLGDQIEASVTKNGSPSSSSSYESRLDMSSMSTQNVGETWTYDLSGTTAVANTSIDIDEVGTGFASHASIPAAYNVGYVAGTNILSVARNDASDFVSSFTAGNAGSATVTPTDGTEWQDIEIDFTGAARHGETWTVTLDGVSRTATIGSSTLADSRLVNTLARVAEYFTEQFSGYAPQVSGTSATFTSDTPFTATVAVQAAAKTGAVSLNSSASTVSHWNDLELTVTGATHQDAVWRLTLDEWNGGSQQYDVTISDFDTNLTINASDVAAAFAAQIAGATASGATITLPTGVLYGASLTILPAALEGDISATGTLAPDWSHELKLLDADNAFNTNDAWTLVVGGNTYNFMAASDDDLADVVADLAVDMAADFDVTTADSVTPVGDDTLVLRLSDGASFTTTSVQQDRLGASTVSSTQDTGSVRFDAPVDITLDLGVGEPFPFGERWTILINGVGYHYDVPQSHELSSENQNLTFIANQLRAEIASAQIDGSPLYSVSSSGNTITINSIHADSPYDTISPGVARGDGTVRGVFDIDYSSPVTGSTPYTVIEYVETQVFTGFGTTTVVVPTPITTYHNFVRSTTLELLYEDPLTPGVWTIEHTVTGSDLVDKGSISTTEPFMDYSLSKAGNYRIQVGALLDYEDDAPFADEMTGVTSGLSYQLNVSVQRHDRSANAVDLIGKEVTFLSGEGLGQTAEIRGYDPITKTFTAGIYNPTTMTYDPIDFSTDAGSQLPSAGDDIEISFNLSGDSGYTKVDDTYSVVLTTMPQVAELVVNVTPAVTRTYNSELAFNADEGFGQNTAQQVMVATPRAEVYLTGTPSANEVWSLELDDVVYAINANDHGLNRTNIANALAGIIQSTVRQDGATYTATVTSSADGDTILVTAVNGLAAENFFARGYITPDTLGMMDIESVEQSDESSTWTDITVSLSGTPAMNELWSLTVDGQTVDYTTTYGDTLAVIADELQSELSDQGITVEAVGRKLEIRVNGSAVTTYQIQPTSLASIQIQSQIVFTGGAGGNWDTPQFVNVRAIDDSVVDGNDAIVFPAMSERINRLRGPLFVDGGIQVGEERFLENPFLLPGETNFPLADGFVTNLTSTPVNGVDENGLPAVLNYVTLQDVNAVHVDPTSGQLPGFDPRFDQAPFEVVITDGVAAGLRMNVLELVGTDTLILEYEIEDLPGSIRSDLLEGNADHYFVTPVNPNTRVEEDVQVDVLQIFNGNSVSDDVGTLTADRVYGFGMGPDTVIGENRIPGGISYSSLEEVLLEMGSGIDQLTIESTHQGTTRVLGGDNDDVIDVHSVAGHTRIEGGDGADHVLVSSPHGLINEIADLLTVDGGLDDDLLTLDDTSNTNDNTGQFNATKIRQLGMGDVAEDQLVHVHARAGTYELDAGTFGTAVLDYSWTSAEVETALNTLFGSADTEVTLVETVDMRNGEAHSKQYRIRFGGTLAGVDMPLLTWLPSDDHVLTPHLDSTARVTSQTIQDGGAITATPSVHTLTIDASAGSFELAIGTNRIAIAYDADKVALWDLLDQTLNPNNAFLDRPHTDNFRLDEYDGTFLITLLGEYATETISVSDESGLTGTVTVERRNDGINYYGTESVVVHLGSGHDEFNVQSTNASTVADVYGGVGNDSFDITSDANGDLVHGPTAHGTLDGIAGRFNVHGDSGEERALHQ